MRHDAHLFYSLTSGGDKFILKTHIVREMVKEKSLKLDSSSKECCLEVAKFPKQLLNIMIFEDQIV